MKDVEGTMEKAGMGSFFAEYQSRYFQKTIQFLREKIFQQSFLGVFAESGLDCDQIFTNSIPIKDEQTQ